MHLLEADSAGAGNVFVACGDQRERKIFEKHRSLLLGAPRLFRNE